jgi:AcrR family transcriptional regulator
VINPNGDGRSRRRRSSQEVHELLLGAARRTFAARGYAHSSTHEIAEAAGVSEALLFRYFGTKAKLFELAVVAPFQRLMDAQVAGSRRGDDVGWLYDLLSQNRDLVVALLAAQAHELDLSDNPELAHALARLHMAAELELAVRGLDGVDLRPVPVTFAMVFALAVFADWLFPPDQRPSRETIVREITHCMLEGLAHHESND